MSGHESLEQPVADEEDLLGSMQRLSEAEELDRAAQHSDDLPSTAESIEVGESMLNGMASFFIQSSNRLVDGHL